MADTGAPSGATGASHGAARTSPAPETFLRTTTASAPPVPDNISVIHLRNSSRVTDVLGDVPENLGKPVEPDIEDLIPARQEESEGVVVEHGHHGVLAILGVKPELREKQVTKVGQMSEVNQQSVEEASQSIGQQSSMKPTQSQQMKSTTLVNLAPPQPRPSPVPALAPSFQSTVASQESTLKNEQKINDFLESNGNQLRQRDQSLEAQPVDEMEKQEVEREKITEVERDSGEEEQQLKLGDEERTNQVEEGIQVQMEGETERVGRLVETQQATTREGKSDDQQQQGLIGLLAKSRLAPSSDSPSVGGERSDLEEQGDKVTDRLNSDLPLLPQLVGSVSDEEGRTKAESDPPTHLHNVTTSTSSTSTPSSSSSSSSRKAPQETPQGARTTQPIGFHTSGVSSNSTSLLSGLPRERVRPGRKESEILEEDEALVDSGGHLEREQKMEEEEELDNSEVLRVQLQPEDSILLRSLTGRPPTSSQGVTQAVNLGGDEEEEGLLGGGSDIEEPSLDEKTETGHVKDILGEGWNLQEEDLADESHDEGDYLDYGVYDKELESVKGFLVPEEGSAGPVIEYQEFVSLNPVKVFKGGLTPSSEFDNY